MTWATASKAILAAMGMALALPAPATAQSITLSNDDRTIMEVLSANSFRHARIIKRGLTKVRVHACEGDSKYLVKVSILGVISGVARLGPCDLGPQPAVETKPADVEPQPAEDLRARLTDVLAQQGYRRIVVTDAAPPRFSADACRGDDRVRLAFNRRGRVRSERVIGPCERQFDPATITALLERNGYDRVRVMQDRRPPFVARACRGDDRMEVEIGRFGRVREGRRLRTCRTEVDAADVPERLRAAGFDRIRMLQTRRTPYLAEACRNEELVEVKVNRFGRIGDTQRVGRCATAITRDAMLTKIREAGYSNVDLGRNDDGWAATACRETARVSLVYDAYGDLQSDRASGTCRSKTVLDMLKNLEGRGAKSVTAMVEGCFRNTRYRWTFDRLGNRTGREAIGGC